MPEGIIFDHEKNSPFSSLDEEVEYDGSQYNDKKKVDCICPKCGRKHVMSFHWSGRGTPRKYCPPCKGGHR